jgi:hypothetical protein
VEISLVVTLKSRMSRAVWAGSWDDVIVAVLSSTLIITASRTVYGLNSMIAALILHGAVAALAIVWE